jgi:hypothetical protein
MRFTFRLLRVYRLAAHGIQTAPLRCTTLPSVGLFSLVVLSCKLNLLLPNSHLKFQRLLTQKLRSTTNSPRSCSRQTHPTRLVNAIGLDLDLMISTLSLILVLDASKFSFFRFPRSRILEGNLFSASCTAWHG